MGIKKTKKGYLVSVHKRHPETRVPKSLKRNALTMAEAKRIEHELVIAISDEFRKEKYPPWEQFVKEFYEFRIKAGICEKTRHTELSCISKWTFAAWSGKTLDSFQKGEMKIYFAENFASISLAQLKYIVSKIRAVFKHAVEMGILKENPTPQFSIKVPKKIPITLTAGEVAKLLDAAREMDHSWYPVWAFASYTGMRSGELYALTWENVDTESKVIYVKRNWNKRDGFKHPKDYEDRVVPISENLMPIIRELKVNRMWGDFVLPRSRYWDGGEQARVLKGFEKGLGLPPANFHALRASWATTLLANNVSVIAVMSMGGWADPDTMMGYIRKSGIDLIGLTDNLKFHNHNRQVADVIPIGM